ncbi:phospholipase C [Gryllotalpicola ginsengisoli]|uniref:phospholipase C n=1 Tax=Gryllotalpicola ginsengisoli TaxID=444608 RepID=UPI000403821F|nr:alkaline phosphatase family protein [Gryllotalpicola ginsengisoli]
MFQKARLRRFGMAGGALVVAAGLATATALLSAPAQAQSKADNSAKTSTPIKHLVVIFDENVSFDHYFGTYPYATNTDGTDFTAAKNTPKVNNLITSGTLTDNPNTYDPQRLSSDEAVTCDQNHNYGPEQVAVDNGKMDQFVEATDKENCGLYSEPGLVMDYYDGNTVTGLWNYAQNYAMSDNSWDATFGPSTPGALNLISGQTYGVTSYDPTTGTTDPQPTATPDSYTVVSPNEDGVGTVINDPDPVYDDCSDTNHTSTSALAGMSGKNIGDLLNEKGVTWGWFQGGFAPTTSAEDSSTGYAVCGSTHTNVAGSSSVDYSPHHNPFQYYKSTSNPHHLAPSSVENIGKTDQANHQYDLTDFSASIKAGSLPAVSFLKAPEYQDGHAAYSDPTDEQTFLVNTINEIQQSKYWSSTAVVIAYDDSDGWYDHQAPTITNSSDDAAEDSTICTTAASNGVKALGGYADRCGPSQRLPMLVISPYTKANTVDHTLTTQPSILKFIEDNWGTGRIGNGSFDATAGSMNGLFDFKSPQNREVLLNPSTGAVSKIVKTSPITPGKTSPVKPGKTSTPKATKPDSHTAAIIRWLVSLFHKD